MKNKKIVSYTLAATLATSRVPNADSEVVSATENNSVENNADENLKENVCLLYTSDAADDTT